MAAAESQTKAAGTSPTTDIKGKIIEYIFYLTKQGYRDTTIKQRSKLLQTLIKRGANLTDPESVKEIIAKQKISESYKLLLTIAYDGFAKFCGITWERPNYKQIDKYPFIPYENEIDDLIAGSGKKTSTLLQLLKETAFRLGEAWYLKWTDIDLKNKIITLNDPEKNSNSGIYVISDKLAAMLSSLKRQNQYVFGGAAIHSAKINFLRQRRRLANKLKNPRLLKISFHTIRHWKATMLYHQTKDILYVMKFLRHKNIKNTLKYIDLEKAYFPKTNEEYIAKIAKTEQEICELIEAGFEYVCDFQDGKIFRKRK